MKTSPVLRAQRMLCREASAHLDREIKAARRRLALIPPLTETLPASLCSEYDSAAEWCAKRGLKGKVGDALPANMDANGALRFIQADPESFEERVRQFAYGLAMEKAEPDAVRSGSFEHGECGDK